MFPLVSDGLEQIEAAVLRVVQFTGWMVRWITGVVFTACKKKPLLIPSNSRLELVYSPQ